MSLLLHGQPVPRVRFEATVVSLSKHDHSFKILTRESGKYFTCVSSFAIPVREGDRVTGSGIRESETTVRLVETPMVQADTSREGLVRIMLMRLRGCTSAKARILYDWLEKQSSESVASWLDTGAEDYCRSGSTERLQALIEACPGCDVARFFRWWHRHSSIRRLHLLGLSSKEVKQIHLPYDQAYRLLLENPYLVVEVPLETCDKIVQQLKLRLPDRARRTGEIARILLDHVLDRQWTCTPLAVLQRQAPDLSVHLAELQAELFPSEGSRGYGCVLEYDCLYLPYQHQVEKGLADLLRSYRGPVDGPDAYFSPSGRQPSADQVIAINTSLRQGVSSIIGEGGTGKTVAITYLGSNFDLQDKKWVAVSFTGKAVSRIKKVTGYKNVYTLHRVLTRELPGVTVVIVDESSMVETSLLYTFLRNHPLIRQVVLIGDPNQLLTIGWGSMFLQVLSSSLPMSRLSSQHRQLIDNPLYANLHRILARQAVVSEGNFRLEEGDVDQVLYHIHQCVDRQEEVVVVSPVKRVIDELNLLVRNIVNPDGEKVTEPRTHREWRTGDLVMMTENCYDLDVMNGEDGPITRINEHWVEVEFPSGRHRIPFEPRYVSPDEEDNDEFTPPVSTKLLVLRYVLTVHRVQGSEYRNVIAYAPPGVKASSFFCNNLVYTQCGRAQSNCVVVGDLEQFQRAIAHEPSTRYENLGKRLDA